LLVAHRLYKVVNCIKLVESQAPDLYLNHARKNNLVLHLHLLNSYKKLVAIILYLDLKKKFNLRSLEADFISDSEVSHYLQINAQDLHKNLNVSVNPAFF
jgi:GH35 family endo-1,4-beta-xylanase